MFDHNEESYRWFLKILFGFELHFVWYCCCNRMILRQWEDVNALESGMIDDENATNQVVAIENTEYDQNERCFRESWRHRTTTTTYEHRNN